MMFGRHHLKVIPIVGKTTANRCGAVTVKQHTGAGILRLLYVFGEILLNLIDVVVEEFVCVAVDDLVQAAHCL